MSLLLALVLAGCSDRPEVSSPPELQPGPQNGRPVARIRLFPLPEKLERSCLEAATHAPILCPSVFPRRTVQPPSALVTQQLRLGNGLYGVELGYSAPYEGAPKRNRPDRFLHFVVIAQTGATGYTVRAERLGPTTIGERHGDLTYVTEFSIHFEHVVFTWEEGGVTYQASLHAWDDREATIELLRELVTSLGHPAEL